MACHSPTSFLKSNTFTMVSAAGRQKQHVVVNTGRLSLRIKLEKTKVWNVCVTFCVWAGLCEGLAVCEHGYPHHRHAEDAAVLTGLILDGHRQTDRETEDWLMCVRINTKTSLLENEMELWSSSESFRQTVSVDCWWNKTKQKNLI